MLTENPNLFKEIITCGFVIYNQEDKFILKKNSSKISNLVLEEKEYSTFEEAIQVAKDLLFGLTPKEWIIIVRYNRGLGIEYKNIPTILATTREEADSLAKKQIKNFFDSTVKILEIKVKPKQE